MRIVNLASRPFLNRRPVRRISIFLWVVGALLCAVTVWLYAEYFRGTTINRARLAELGAEIEAADEAAEAVTRRLQRLDLAERNSRIHFLNEVIEKRTFPWSRLFDDLEDVLLDDIYLRSVTPAVAEEDEESGGVRRRVITPAEARERARRERRERRGEAADEAANETAEAETAPAEPEMVNLTLLGLARTDEALLDFVDALYAADDFLEPYLSTERREQGGREVSFQITVRYLLPATPPPPPVQQVASTGAPADGEATIPRDVEDAGGPQVVVVEPSDEPADESATRTGSRPERQNGEAEAATGTPGRSAVSVSGRTSGRRGGDRTTASPREAEETRSDRRTPRRSAVGTVAGGRSTAGAEPAGGRQEQRPTSRPAPNLAEPSASAARSVGEGSRRRPER